MKNYIKNLGYIALCATLTFTACSDDRDALIEDLDFDRALSPVDVKATVENIVNVKLTWIAVPNAVSYKIDIYDISEDETGTLTASFASETNNVLITGLGGGTKYRALVTSIGGEGIADSKTSEVTFTTGNEQIFVDIVDADLEINSVIVRWSAGEIADVIYVIDQNNEDAEKLTFEITEEEIEAGAKELTGLNDNTKYKIELRRDGKIRGTLSVTTPEDLSWAIQVAPEDDFATMILNANDGDVFVLGQFEYTVPKIEVSKNITIRGTRSARKGKMVSTNIRIKEGAGLELKYLEFDGTGTESNNQMIVFDDDANYDTFVVDDCEIYNYVKGAFYVNKVAVINKVKFVNNIYRDVICEGGDMFDFRKGYPKSFEFKNNTLYNVASGDRDLFRMDKVAEGYAELTIENNTFDKVGVTKRYLYVRVEHKINFNRNIISNTNAFYRAVMDGAPNLNIESMTENNYFNAPNFTASTTVDAFNDTSSSAMKLDPEYADAENGDFTVGNSTLKDKSIGDKRWIP